MHIIKEDIHRILDPFTTLTLMGEDMLERIIEDPSQPLMKQNDKGIGVEDRETYDTKISFLDICREGQAKGARRMDVFYDFFFGGSKRENYPDSPKTLEAYKIIHDIAKEHGMSLAASLISPLDTGGEYVKTHENKGQTMQFREGIIRPDGSYETVMDFQMQWTNNKGPSKVTLKEVKAFAFDEERIEDTPFYYVNENEIEDISSSVEYRVDEDASRVTQGGYGYTQIYIRGRTESKKTRFLAVVIYHTLEIDYFADDALDYMKSILDLHKAAGITYEGIYSDEMHIQYDWDSQVHWGEKELTTRYMTDSMASAYAEKYGRQYRDFTKYLVYFVYMQHDFLEGEEGRVPAQHVFGKNREDIVRTFVFRRHYFDLLQRRVVDLCTQTKEYAAELFGCKMQATGHSTWMESPTCDTFFRVPEGEDPNAVEHSRYDYTPEYVWSAAQRENISACNDHFKWNEYFWAVGTDIPEGGFLDRNYYGAAYSSSLAALNAGKFAYYCIWGNPDQVKERMAEVGQSYGHYTGYCKSYDPGHNLLQGCTTRESDVLTVCPMDLNYLEERFGNWMVQYGYTDYITEEKLLQHAREPEGPMLWVQDRAYRALVVTFSPLMNEKTLRLIRKYVQQGGKVIWCSAPALREEEGASALFRDTFGIQSYAFDKRGIPAQGKKVTFPGFASVKDMKILSDLFPDYVYPVIPGAGSAVAVLDGQTVGVRKDYPGGGSAVYMGLRVRDDQSCSTGEDVDTLFTLLCALGGYTQQGSEISSRPAAARYIYNRFPNGTVSLSNHFRTFREMSWHNGFYRDEARDDAFMEHVSMPPHDITLEDMRIEGHRVSYRGEGIVTYRYTQAEGLLALGGRNTCGISIDGQEYQLSRQPVNIIWGKLDEKLLDPQTRRAYVLKCNSAGRLTLPFDGTHMQCALCRDYLLDPVEAYPFTCGEKGVVIDLDEKAVDRFLVFYQ